MINNILFLWKSLQLPLTNYYGFQVFLILLPSISESH